MFSLLCCTLKHEFEKVNVMLSALTTAAATTTKRLHLFVSTSAVSKGGTCLSSLVSGPLDQKTVEALLDLLGAMLDAHGHLEWVPLLAKNVASPFPLV